MRLHETCLQRLNKLELGTTKSFASQYNLTLFAILSAEFSFRHDITIFLEFENDLQVLNYMIDSTQFKIRLNAGKIDYLVYCFRI